MAMNFNRMSQSRALNLAALILVLLWTGGLSVSLLWNIQDRQNVTLDEAQREVRAYLNKDMLFRNWVAEHGGIYIPSDESTTIDPILSQMSDGTVVTEGGKKLTWASHAFVTRRLHERSAKKLNVYGRIVGADSEAPESAPDAWERRALDRFLAGEDEVAELTTIDGESYMRVMQPAISDVTCLQCHSDSEPGNIRGGISASIPMDPYFIHESKEIRHYLLIYAVIWLIGILGFGLAANRLARRARERDIAENALRESEEIFRSFSAAAQDAILFMDNHGKITFWNHAAETTFGYTGSEAIGKDLHELIVPQRFHEAFMAAYPGFLETGAGSVMGRTLELAAIRKGGAEFPVEVSLSSTKIGGQRYGLGILRDITERKSAQHEVERALNIQRVLDAILHLSLPSLTLKEVLSKSLDAFLSIPFFALQDKGAIFLVVDGSEELEMVVQRNLPDQLLTACALLPFGKCLCGRAAASRSIIFASGIDERHEIGYAGMHPHGHYCLPVMSGDSLLGVLNAYVPANHKSSEDEEKFLKTVTDTLGVVIERKKAEEKLSEMAHQDHLTGLPNRMTLVDRMSQALAIARRHKGQFAVLFLDLDHFKEVNDTLGHDAGDLLLKESSTRLMGCVREMDTVARVGGDEFVVVLMETLEPLGAELVARKILDALTRPFDIGGRECSVGTSIGIAMYPEDGEDSETLIKHADAAMYQAKRKRNTYCFHNKDIRKSS